MTYDCELCNYKTSRINNFKIHCKSRKHTLLSNKQYTSSGAENDSIKKELLKYKEENDSLKEKVSKMKLTISSFIMDE